MTLLVRDEVDILESQIAFHLNAGVDFVVVTDHGSVDGTAEVLERFASLGVLHVIRESGREYRQAEWVTRMARQAASEFGADWVINADADEFWWPRGRNLKEVLAAIPARFDVVRGFWRHFVPRPDDGRSFAERMTVRCRTEPTLRPFNAQVKVAHRASPAVVVAGGNHDVTGPSNPLRTWYPFEVLHFPMRSFEQARRKYRVAAEASQLDPERVPRRPFVVRAAEAESRGAFPSLYDEVLVGDERLARGLAQGELALDTRVRDVLRRIDAVGLRDVLRGRAKPVELPPVETDELYVHDLGVATEFDALERVLVRTEILDRRLRQAEQVRSERLVYRLARALHR